MTTAIGSLEKPARPKLDPLALAVIGGEERKVHFFAMDLPPHSDGCLLQAYPAESSEAFCEGYALPAQ